MRKEKSKFWQNITQKFCLDNLKIVCKFDIFTYVLKLFMRINYSSHNKTNKRSTVKIIFLHTIYQNSDAFLSVSIIFRELQNIKKTYVKA